VVCVRERLDRCERPAAAEHASHDGHDRGGSGLAVTA